MIFHAINGALLLPAIPFGAAWFVDFLLNSPTVDGADQ